MAAPKFKKNKVSQTINLNDEFGIDFSGKRALKQLIGQAIIDRMVDRTESGTSMKFSGSGRGTPGRLKNPYSKEYADSLEFKAAGKSKDKVNMTLTGEMLGSIDIIKTTGKTIEIGWDDREENNKAFNHSVGDTVPERPFFGVNKKELKAIKREFNKPIKEALRVQQEEGKKAFNEFVLGLIGDLSGDES